MIKISRNFFLFVILGVINNLIGLLLFKLEIILGVPYLLASALMYIYAVFEGFLLNSFFLYKVRPKFSYLLKYLNVYAVSFIFNMGLMYLFVAILGIHKTMAQVFTIALLTVVNYKLVKHLVYNQVRRNG